MKNSKHTSIGTTLLKYTVALVLCCCLLLLTGINFIIYNAGAGDISMAMQITSTEIPEGDSPEKPIEEKSASPNLNIEEEFVHELHALYTVANARKVLKYSLLDEAKLALIHYELLSPPPDL